MPFEGRSNASRMAFFLGGHFVRLPRFSFQQGTTSTLKNLFERHPNPKIPKKYHFKIISPHADLHRPRRFQNLPLQTCGSPYDFQICLCAPHSPIHFQNLSLQTCGVPNAVFSYREKFDGVEMRSNPSVRKVFERYLYQTPSTIVLC